MSFRSASARVHPSTSYGRGGCMGWGPIPRGLREHNLIPWSGKAGCYCMYLTICQHLHFSMNCEIIISDSYFRQPVESKLFSKVAQLKDIVDINCWMPSTFVILLPGLVVYLFLSMFNMIKLHNEFTKNICFISIWMPFTLAQNIDKTSFRNEPQALQYNRNVIGAKCFTIGALNIDLWSPIFRDFDRSVHT